MQTETFSPWFLIIGLGNPGREYRGSRHNVGFMVIDTLANRLDLPLSRRQADALVVDGRIGERKIILAKPQTYMNLSGRSVSSLVRFYKVPETQLLVLHDDLDLPLGAIRIRPGGGSGGHRGMKSIIEQLGTQEFPRQRIGIGRPSGARDPADYVLSDFGNDEELMLTGVLERGADCALKFINEGISAAMNCCNPAQS
jgi:PTH1 family peptidyl-tRNA hydrolase